MRNDMSRILVERPRFSHADRNPDVVRIRRRLGNARNIEDYEKMPKRGRMRPAGAPVLNENLAPLRRFLLGSCGRSWNAVYSELRQGLSPRSAVQMHIIEHLFDYVHLHVELRPDGVYGRRRWGGGPNRLTRTGWTFYVDPRDGKLKEPRTPRERYARGREVARVPFVELNDHVLALKLKGQWYRVETSLARHDAWDVVRGVRVGASLECEAERLRFYGERYLMATSKLQMGRRALRAAGLRS